MISTLHKRALVEVVATMSAAAFARKPAITKEEAHAIGVDAYLYALVSMDITRK